MTKFKLEITQIDEEKKFSDYYINEIRKDCVECDYYHTIIEITDKFVLKAKENLEEQLDCDDEDQFDYEEATHSLIQLIANCLVNKIHNCQHHKAALIDEYIFRLQEAKEYILRRECNHD